MVDPENQATFCYLSVYILGSDPTCNEDITVHYVPFTHDFHPEVIDKNIEPE
jgi:hypothetical protein